MILERPEERICTACLKTLPPAGKIYPRCMKCSRPIRDVRRELCGTCASQQPSFDRAFAPYVYEKGMRGSVLRMKFENRREYLDFYAHALWREGRSFLRMAGSEARILPVPMHPKKVRRRGFDQCRILAQKLSALSGIPVNTGCLVRVRDTLPQKGLSGLERRRNLSGAFRVERPWLLPESVILLDDIFTTGSTVEEISGLLRQNGVRRIWVLTLCITREGPEGQE